MAVQRVTIDNLSQNSLRLGPSLSHGRDVVVFSFVRVLRGTGAFDRRGRPSPGERQQHALRVLDEALSVLQQAPLDRREAVPPAAAAVLPVPRRRSPS